MRNFYKLIVLFDLPSKTKLERRDYGKFRNYLIKSGYERLQFSVYVRTCENYDYVKMYKRQLIDVLPKSGSIRILTITQSQYDKMQILLGERLTIDENPEYEQLTIA